MKPNIILVTTDQQRTVSLSCYGSSFTSTPNLDRMAAEGLRFDRAYCASPTCTPARASLFSGQSLSRHGAWNIGTNIPADVPLLSHRLQSVGYRTQAIGKLHFQAYGGGGDSRESCDLWEDQFRGWNDPDYAEEKAQMFVSLLDHAERLERRPPRLSYA